MGSLPPELGALQCHTRLLHRDKSQVGMAAPVQPCWALCGCHPLTDSSQPALCWLHGLPLVPSLVAPSLLLLQASWDTAEGTWMCHSLSWCWAGLCQFPQELEAGDFSDGEAGPGPSCLPSCRLPQAVGGILCGWSKLSLCSFCWPISFAVVCICCPLAQSS